MEDTRTQTPAHFLIRGAVWGVIASLAMAMYAMIASPLVGSQDMMASMQMLHVNLGPLLLGALIHMMWGAMYGIVFAFLARQFGLAGPMGFVFGIVFGLLVMAFMMLVVLPLVGAGAMPKTVGFSFGIEHAVFGMVLGLWPLLRPAEFRRTGQARDLATR
jgi:hypothetical protein